LWRAGLPGFKQSIIKHYAKPSIHQPLLTVRECEKQLKKYESQAHKELAHGHKDAFSDEILGWRNNLEYLKHPELVQGEIQYFREREAFWDKLWNEWSAQDPRSRLEYGKDLSPQQGAGYALEAVRNMVAESPLEDATILLEYLDYAEEEARQAQDTGLIAKVADARADLRSAQLAYAISEAKANTPFVLDDDSDSYDKGYEKFSKFVRAILSPSDYELFQQRTSAHIKPWWQPDAPEPELRRLERGPILLIEQDRIGANRFRVIVASDMDEEFAQGLLESLAPELLSDQDANGNNTLDVKTIDQYLDGLRAAPGDIKKYRADLRRELGRHFAIIYHELK
jgi:hypothetical protein